jgi:hypothetical protein
VINPQPGKLVCRYGHPTDEVGQGFRSNYYCIHCHQDLVEKKESEANPTTPSSPPSSVPSSVPSSAPSPSYNPSWDPWGTYD